jgi:DNA-binding MarR family transcriptional regulator
VVADPGDRRVKLVRCTPAGLRLRRSLRAAVRTVERRWRTEVGAGSYAVFREVLAALTAAEH